MKFYEAFGLEPALSLDVDDLKKRFYDRSRQWHPDKFSRASAQEQEKALEMTAVLNDAFRTLREPVSRAEYFLKESGIELSKEAPPELLEEVFELNMALEELRDGDESTKPQEYMPSFPPPTTMNSDSVRPRRSCVRYFPSSWRTACSIAPHVGSRMSRAPSGS